MVRPYEIADRAACLRAFDSNTPRYFLPEERIQFERFLDQLPGPYFVVVEGDDLTACGGYATGRVKGEADICWTIVRRDRHARSIGSILLTTIVSEILGLENVHAVRLETSQHTRAFFERLGFRAVDVVLNGFGPGLDRVEMRAAVADLRQTDNR